MMAVKGKPNYMWPYLIGAPYNDHHACVTTGTQCHRNIRIVMRCCPYETVGLHLFWFTIPIKCFQSRASASEPTLVKMHLLPMYLFATAEGNSLWKCYL